VVAARSVGASSAIGVRCLFMTNWWFDSLNIETGIVHAEVGWNMYSCADSGIRSDVSSMIWLSVHGCGLR
jgi:hypothetical protein